MLEILFLISLSKKFSARVVAKGYKATWFIVMFIAFWVTGEIVGMAWGSFMTQGVAVYLFALAGAGVGTLMTHIIISNLSPKPQEPLELE